MYAIMEVVSKVFPKKTYAVMVHKLYVDRVKKFLYGVERDWIEVLDNNGVGVNTSSNNTCSTSTPSSSSSSPPPVELLDTPSITGVSRARRGYVLLLFKNVPREMADLSPFARQNISWVGRITHHQQWPDENITNNSTIDTTIGDVLWKNFCQKIDTDLKKVLLRVDCYPRSITEQVCLQLQQAAAADDDHNNITDAFEGPIPMTMSRSKCTHRLTVIVLLHSITKNYTTLYWGWETNRNVIDLKLNHEASNEIRIVPANIRTGADADGTIIDCAAPVSRAYYKLQQVIDDMLLLSPKNGASLALTGAGLDLGAAPGGWTQVLLHHAKLCPVVVAVDAAQLAHRVSRLPQVVHIQSSMEAAQLPTHCRQYSIVVCDACVNWNDLLDDDVLIRVLIQTANQWTVPAFAVITLKLPFKTVGSIQNHIQSIHEKLPHFLWNMCQTMYPKDSNVDDTDESTTVIKPAYRLVHLMANSDSERTLIAKFDK
jgi:23S rRNA U2552 (ribose-2'-O)-methylase RlmE/FtsJ